MNTPLSLEPEFTFFEASQLFGQTVALKGNPVYVGRVCGILQLNEFIELVIRFPEDDLHQYHKEEFLEVIQLI